DTAAVPGRHSLVALTGGRAEKKCRRDRPPGAGAGADDPHRYGLAFLEQSPRPLGAPFLPGGLSRTSRTALRPTRGFGCVHGRTGALLSQRTAGQLGGAMDRQIVPVA